ncbi:MAG TPA: tetratricopeptide repeat protein [Tahibacter sp.]|uniref:O-linked N-acetylglucosamine transferase, SPINDLY family protein n=1 Tax=Tahibacter sp. TaxID=2056211 RepID=UPI002BF99D69|nr:tetratricopeptide repeat protein [Tahibacter sp.]HSX62969.1 tetratricopeptide repeat protein [Tahibacter sp.]
MSGTRAAFDTALRSAQQALARGDAAGALAPLRQCLTFQPQQTELWLQTAVTAFQAGQPALARELLQQAAQRWPADTTVLFHLAYLQELGGDGVAATASYRAVLALDPQHADTLRNLAGVLSRGGEGAAAFALLERLIALRPGDVELLVVTAELALRNGDAAAAQSLAQSAVDLAPQHAAALRALARAARQRRDLDVALPVLERAVALLPGQAGLVADLGQAQIEAGLFEAGVATLRRAASLPDPQQRTIAWLGGLALPALMDSEDAVLAARERFAVQLERIHDGLRLDTPAQIDSAYAAICRVLPFPLHYQPHDNRALGRRFGELVQRIMLAAGGELAERPAVRHDRARPRVAFVSAELREHTITRYFARWLNELDGARFERWAFHCGSLSDATTTRIAAGVDAFRHVPLAPLEVAAAIRQSAPDVVIFLDVGMDPAMQALAALPLAPRQYLAYGHPVTSGMAGFDGFLSGAALESGDADAHYCEPLIRLPALGALPQQPVVQVPLRSPRTGGPLQLLCLQSLGKLVPCFDATLARIAKETGACIGFFTGPAGLQPIERRFLARVAAAFRAQGVDAQTHLQLRPRTAYADYLAQIAAADLVLDTPWFSGGATSLDTCHVGTPVVTWEGEFLRARQTAGMLRLLDLPQGVAACEDDYVAAVVRLLDDRAANDALRVQLRARAPKLFEAGTGLDALAAVLDGTRVDSRK